MTRMKVSRKGAVVIPRELRERFGITEGSEVSIIEIGGSIRLVPLPPGDPLEHLYGMFKDGPSLTEGLLKDRRRELEREERDLPSPRSEE